MVPFSLYRTGLHSVREDSHLQNKIKIFFALRFEVYIFPFKIKIFREQFLSTEQMRSCDYI